MKNRYDKILEVGNKKILTLIPANGTLRVITAYEIERALKEKGTVLEIGCGEGDSTLPILQYTNISIDVLDVSPEMIEKCKNVLVDYSKKVSYICKDALDYLKECDPYQIITTSWTIHNFIWKDKIILFEAIYKKLKKGGSLILMDKVYPEKGGKELLTLQLKRLKYLESDLQKEIISHEKQDYKSEYRMDEKYLISMLKKIGFKNIKIVDRIERDVVITARK